MFCIPDNKDVVRNANNVKENGKSAVYYDYFN